MKQEIKEPTMDQNRAQVLYALMNEPSEYFVDVINNKSLPTELKKKKEIVFEIKPPVISTLTRMGKVAMQIPVKYRSMDVDPTEVLQFGEQIAEIFAIMAHGNSSKKMPDWYVPFLMDNCTAKELLELYQESSMKIRTDFFLPCFQIAANLNPMTMKSSH